jgi:hypothetical protein
MTLFYAHYKSENLRKWEITAAGTESQSTLGMKMVELLTPKIKKDR